ncbi:hypothetical protein DH2020_002583 [Rehmannia glutinosa]|uniref:Uncharacterized protein n=1 Tax=Rehmannia glutinosa TaxID=99300 RepID=A0ABR0XU62_REHGL
MELNKILHMNGGDGKTSYANNSGPPKVIISKTWYVLDETLKDMFTENGFPKCMKMADLGCSSGPNTLFLISHIMNTIKDLCKHNNNLNSLPQLEVFLNDLPNNDFNNLFKLLSEFCQNNRKEKKKLEWFVYGVPGSFYDRLFPSNNLHFAYSSCGIHWLSQIPEGVGKNNKENIHVAVTSPQEVIEAYANQFKRDFSRFLRLRAEEITFGGRMVLAFIGRSSEDPFSKDALAILTVLSQILSNMVDQGLIKKDDLYSFNVPLYTPCAQEIEAIISNEGSFNLDKLEVYQVPWDANDDYNDTVFDKYKSGKLVAGNVRSFMEPMLASHFGGSINVDGLFDIYAKKMAEHLSKSKERSSYFIIVISLNRKFTEETSN